MTVHKLSKGLLFLLAATTGLVVANNYYNQPLLGLMARHFQVSELEISTVPILTQIGYAVGLFLIVPLGDKFKRKKLILMDFFLIIAALLAVAFSQTPLQLKVSSFFVGLTSVVPQIMVPMAAQLAEDDKRGAAIGTVMTGMFIGILGSRTISGFVGAHFGWQEMYLIAAVVMVILWIFLWKFLPEIFPDFKGTYGQLLKSIIDQFRNIPKLRLASLRGAFDFGAFTLFWTTVVFLLEGDPFYMGSDVAGALGLVGIAGAMVASFVGKLSDRFNKSTIIYVGTIIIIIAWLILGFSSKSIFGIIIGAFVLDLGVQSVHITNQTIIFEGNPTARNRINTVYMVMYFAGGAFGTFIGGFLWEYFKWNGVSSAGVAFGLMILLVHLIGTKLINQKK